MAVNATRISSVAYLQSTVAAMDGAAPTALTGAGLTAYYTDPGNPPGHWAGTGVAALGLQPGEAISSIDAVRVWQQFRHPRNGTSLGRRPLSERSATTAANDNQLAESTTQQRNDVAGFDLTFTIPKDASILWALGDGELQARIAACHTRAIDQTLEHLEQRVLQTRVGHAGVGSASVTGLIAGTWNHWDNREGDPHLHSHVVVSNRVQRSSDGAWVTLDSRALFKQTVLLSELHQNLFMDELHRDLGINWVPRSNVETNAAIADIEGMPEELRHEFSSRDAMIARDLQRRIATFQETHGRPPSTRETIELKQAAWRATRAPKDKSITPLPERCSAWTDRAADAGFNASDVIGGCIARDASPTLTAATSTTVHDVIAQLSLQTVGEGQEESDSSRIARAADEAVAALSTGRSTWSEANLRAEIERTMRLIRASTPEVRALAVDAITNAALARCVRVTPYRYRVDLTDPRISVRGHSIFDDPHRALWTHQSNLEREQQLITAAEVPGAITPPDAKTARELVAAISAQQKSTKGFALADDQAAAVTGILADSTRLSVLIGPAGTGKTTTMATLRTAWQSLHPGTDALGLTTSAQAAHVLGTELDTSAHTIAKWLHETTLGNDQRAEQRHRLLSQLDALPADAPKSRAAAIRRGVAQLTAQSDAWTMKPGQLIIVDEASMTETAHLAALTAQADAAGAKILLVGDHRQLDAVDAGGALALLAAGPSSHQLTSVWRFHEPWEAKASLALRTVNDEDDALAVLQTYDEHGRLHNGEDDDMLEAAYKATRASISDGRSAILIASTNTVVGDLNARFVEDRRREGEVTTDHLALIKGGLDAGIGERILARRNDRTLTDDHGDFIRNGSQLTIEDITPSGAAIARRQDTGALITLPPAYLAAHCEHGYATTAHRSQGITVDEARLVIPTEQSIPSELLYVAMTRGRSYNAAYVGTPPEDEDEQDGVVLAAADTATWEGRLMAMMQMAGAETAATTALSNAAEEYSSLSRLIPEYEYLASLEDTTALDTLLRDQIPASIDELHASPVHSSLAAAWRAAEANAPDAARAALAEPVWGLRDKTDVDEHLRVLTHRLRNLAAPAPSESMIAGVTPQITDRADATIRDLAAQVRENIDQRVLTITGRAHTAPWAHHLRPEVVSAVAIYRDLYNVRTPSPLGATPAERDTRQHAHYEALRKMLDKPEPPAVTTVQPQPTRLDPTPQMASDPHTHGPRL